MPTGAILFEAPLVTSVIAYLRNDSYSEFVWPFWRYKSLKMTIDSIIATNQLIYLGLDPQETCAFPKFSSFLISEGYIENDVELVKMDSILAISIFTATNTNTRNLTNKEPEILMEIIEKINEKIHWPKGTTKTEKALISLCLENRKYLAKEMTFENFIDRVNFRDSIMALNLNRITEIFEQKIGRKKLIVWQQIDILQKKWIRRTYFG